MFKDPTPVTVYPSQGELRIKINKDDTAKLKEEQNGFLFGDAIFGFKEVNILKDPVKSGGNTAEGERLCALAETLMKNGKSGKGSALFLTIINKEQQAGNKPAEAFAWLRFAAASELKNGVLYYQNAITRLHELKNDDQEIAARVKFMLRLESEGRFDESENEGNIILTNFKQSNPETLAYVHYIMSAINRYKGNFNISLLHILKSIELSNPANKINASRFYGELGEVYQNIGNTSKSIFWYRKTVAIREQIMGEPPEFIIRTVGFIVQQLIIERKPAEALKEVTAAEKRTPATDDYGRALYAQIKADCYNALKRFAEAEERYQTMIRFFEERPSWVAVEIREMAYYDIAKFYIDRHDYSKSSGYVAELSTGFSKSSIMNFELLKFKQDSADQKYLSAIDHFRAYKAINDSIFNTAKNRQLEELQIKYRTREREKDITLLKRTESLQRERIASADKERNFILSGLALLIVLMALLYNGYRHKQRSNSEISTKNASLNQLIDEKDILLEEKQWLLREIHHRVKNNLQIVMGLLQRQSSYIDNKEALTAIKNSENRMYSVALIHQKLYQSQDLNQIYMPDYISELIDYLVDTAEVNNRIKFEKNIDEICLDVSQAVPLGLILNEAITNSIKHAYPAEIFGVISVSLVNEAPNIVLTIADQGLGLAEGFSPENSTSLGLNLIKGLSKQLSGKLTLQNNDGLTLRIAFEPVVPDEIR
ncbi:MAG TPA: histidine kinase dimerization/phosphoacceptor domain -containing protein [Mucilaginibacter sp.]|nr:histidine kinase dimerization/phosphoacceptor domain -containing protein [Mucilaginibacter sp.]